jgi:DNA-binding PadR family transcriptional regulator
MAVREGLLLLLAEQPRHGYELKTLFEQRTGELWQLNTGQIYTTLERLERDGLVEPTGEVAASDARRRSYRLTAAGQDEAAAWLAGTTANDTPRDELVMKILLVAASGDHEAALATIDGHRHELLARLQEVRRRQRAASTASETLSARLVADALAVRAEADLRWLDLCAERLRQRARVGANGGSTAAGEHDGRHGEPESPAAQVRRATGNGGDGGAGTGPDERRGGATGGVRGVAHEDRTKAKGRRRR